MLDRKITLYDIMDVEAFVVMCIKRSGAQVQATEYEDMIAEGICILYGMSLRYEPHMPGYKNPGRFSGYAIKYLPRKMKEAWHKMHEEHLHRTQADGKRRYEYHERASSWEYLTHESRTSVPLIDERYLRHPGEFITPPKRDVLGGQSQ